MVRNLTNPPDWINIMQAGGQYLLFLLTPPLYHMLKTTIVTGIWDLGRDSLGEGWSRSFEHYKDKFSQLLQSLKDVQLIVFIDPKHEDIVWKYRSPTNTVVYHHSADNFDNNFFPFRPQIEKIRTNEQWLSQAGWLKDSTQAKLPLYNPMVMSKMFLLHNAKIFNPFNSEYMYWLDGGICNTVHPGYFSHDNVIEKIQNLTKKFLFICFPYETNSEIHGFDISKMREYSKNDNVNRVARGGFFGGHIDYISEANNLYYSLLADTLSNGLMGTEESIFTIMTYLQPEVYQYESINGDGLISTFFEKVKNRETTIEQAQQSNPRKKHTNSDTVLYINAFNSPEQLQMVLDSFEKYDNSFIAQTKKILINNTTNNELFPQYDAICSKYSFAEHIKKGNLGVCRARQFAAEHFADLGSKYMIFFEDDMLLDYSRAKCDFGFCKPAQNLLHSLIRIMDNEEYDFLKFSFSEFYGHNGEQWSWHNVPSDLRVKYFGGTTKRPLTKFTVIKSYNGLPYAEGEIYYSNWPHIIDQEGNQKLFLDTKWDRPFEQTWMSHIYTLTVNGVVKPAILLASPITHNRVHFYEATERKEN